MVVSLPVQGTGKPLTWGYSSGNTGVCSHLFVVAVGLCSPQGSPWHRDKAVERQVRYVRGDQRKGSRKRDWSVGSWGQIHLG